ncbi:hypothetical protein Tco_0527138 [Tanacetum coccineum]
MLFTMLSWKHVDRPSMLALGNYNPPYKFKWIEKTVPVTKGIDNDIYSTIDASPNACEMWKAIERLKQVLTLITIRMAKNEVNEIRAERLARTANPLALVARQQPAYHPQNHPSHHTQNSSTRSQQATRNRGKAIVMSSEIGRWRGRIVGHHSRKSTNLPTTTFKLHQTPVELIKIIHQELTEELEQADWKDDTDDESDEQELEAHYMYMAQIQEVTPDIADISGPIFDTEPLQKVQNNHDNYNVFAIKNAHLEQPESVTDAYLEEQGDTNITIDSSDMCYDREHDDQDDTDELAQERNLLASLIEKLNYEIDDSKNRNKFLESSNKALVDKLKGEIEDFKTKNQSLESSSNHFKEANNELSKTNQLMFKDLKKSQAELDMFHDVNYASKVESNCAKDKGDLMSYKIEFEKSSNEYTQKINDLNQMISDMKNELFAHQETISIMSQEKEDQINFYKTREDKKLDKAIALENKVKVLDDIVYKTGQSVQTMNMLNRNCKTSFAKPEFLKKAQRANPRLYDIGCYNDNLALMLAPESDETIRLDKESRSKLSDLIRPFDYDQLNNLYDLFVPQREKSPEQHYFPRTSKMSHTSSNNEFSKESFRKQTTLLEKRMDESIPWDQKCKSSKELFKIKKSVDTIFDGVERCKQTIAKRTYFGNIDPFIQNTIEGNFCPQIRRINADLEKFHLCLNEEMVADLRYFNSLEHEVDTLKSQLETQKTQFLNEIDRLSREYYYADHMNAILGVYTDLDEVTNLQCDYLETLEKCEHLEKELSKSRTMSKSFEALQKHAINLELDLQQCKEKIKNDKSFKENQSNVFLKEREQYFEIQDLKAQLQDKGIAISELKKLIEKMKGKSVETKFEKSSVIRQPNAFKSQRQSILGLVVHMLIEKKYPLKKEILMQMLKLKLESEEDSTMALELIRFIKKVLADLESPWSDCAVPSKMTHSSAVVTPYLISVAFDLLRDALSAIFGLSESNRYGFGGNAATKKTQKTLLKQQYENFSATSAESLDSIFNRLQKIVVDVTNVISWDTLLENAEHQEVRKISSEIKTTPGSKETNEMAEEHVSQTWLYGILIEVYTDKTCSKACLNNYETLKKQYDDLLAKQLQTKFESTTYKRGLDTIEAQLVTYRKNEVLFSEEVAILKRDVEFKQYEINKLKAKFERLKQAKDAIDFKIEKFDKASKDLDQLLGSQITDKSKKESNIIKESDNSKENSDKSLVKELESQVKGCFVKGCECHTSKKVSEEEPKKVRENNDAPIIKDWVSDDEEQDESITRLEKKTVTLTAAKIEKPIRKSVRHRIVNTARSYRTPVNTVRPRGKPQHDDKGFVDSGCSRHMTGNIAYLSDFKKFDGGYVAFGGDGFVWSNLCGSSLMHKKEKGIKREYSVARTPQQNGVAERRNKDPLIMAAHETMLADSNVQSLISLQVEDGSKNNENAEQERFSDDSSSRSVNVLGKQVNITASPNEEDSTEEEPEIEPNSGILLKLYLIHPRGSNAGRTRAFKLQQVWNFGGSPYGKMALEQIGVFITRKSEKGGIVLGIKQGAR